MFLVVCFNLVKLTRNNRELHHLYWSGFSQVERTILHPDQRLFPLFQEGILQGDGDGGVYIQGENIFYCHEMKYLLSKYFLYLNFLCFRWSWARSPPCRCWTREASSPSASRWAPSGRGGSISGGQRGSGSGSLSSRSIWRSVSHVCQAIRCQSFQMIQR